MRAPSRPTAWLLLPLFALLLACLACPAPAPPPPAHDGPIVLITIDSLRADVLGSLGGPEGVTPNLDALAAEADFAGRAVSTSSWTVPSMASLFTGLQPWRHGNQHSERTVLSDELLTLPEALQAHGYGTTGFRSNHWLQAKYGYAQGFETFRDLAYGQRAMNTLRELPDGRQFVWIHILPPHAPYVRYDNLLGQLPQELQQGAATLPDKVRPLDLEPFYDPAVALTDEARREFWSMYLSNVAWADELVGKLTAALRESGLWDRTLLAVTADHGEEFGESGQITHGGNLNRALLEVPLLVKLPQGFEHQLTVSAQDTAPVAQHRLFATLLEAAGAGVPSYAAPSLFDEAPPEVLSELYLGNGVNTFSLVTEGQQLIWTSTFTTPEPQYFKARLQILGAPQPELSEDPEQIFKRLADAYLQQLPLTGRPGDEPDLRLFHWASDGGSEAIDDTEAARRLARRLRKAWLDLNGDEILPSKLGADGAPVLTPEDEAEMRALGYAGGGQH